MPTKIDLDALACSEALRQSSSAQVIAAIAAARDQHERTHLEAELARRARLRLSRSQREVLFAVGVRGNARRSAIYGQALRRPSIESVRGMGLWTDGDVLRDVLTPAGTERFAAEFGAPCPEHGWHAVFNQFDGFYRRCEACRDAAERVLQHPLPKRLLQWEREALQTIAQGTPPAYPDQHRRATSLLAAEELVTADGKALTPSGVRLLLTADAE